jgi:predicted transcriptional regulator
MARRVKFDRKRRATFIELWRTRPDLGKTKCATQAGVSIKTVLDWEQVGRQEVSAKRLGRLSQRRILEAMEFVDALEEADGQRRTLAAANAVARLAARATRERVKTITRVIKRPDGTTETTVRREVSEQPWQMDAWIAERNDRKFARGASHDVELRVAEMSPDDRARVLDAATDVELERLKGGDVDLANRILKRVLAQHGADECEP